MKLREVANLASLQRHPIQQIIARQALSSCSQSILHMPPSRAPGMLLLCAQMPVQLGQVRSLVHIADHPLREGATHQLTKIRLLAMNGRTEEVFEAITNAGDSSGDDRRNAVKDALRTVAILMGHHLEIVGQDAPLNAVGV
eukprot:CAMPEP_0180671052 /NCGR_PEP_ID=MMETSP1037_2-20121125/64372_1 /TAXON_ID=632150 /ORGANISM="Azadinium spinosum, Strain 3D9" /LENGTH=140 /DNA_ID=CAMNT_0022700061 /DNA_START=443 /DNA_END=863 /DNA_ORIENTATION=+